MTDSLQQKVSSEGLARVKHRTQPIRAMHVTMIKLFFCVASSTAWLLGPTTTSSHMPQHSKAKKVLYEDHEDSTDEGIYTPPMSPVLRAPSEHVTVIIDDIGRACMSPLVLPPTATCTELTESEVKKIGDTQLKLMRSDECVNKREIKFVWDMDTKELDKLIDTREKAMGITAAASVTCKRWPGWCTSQGKCPHRSLAEEIQDSDNICLICGMVTVSGYCECFLEMTAVDLEQAAYRFEFIIKIMKLQREYRHLKDHVK